MMRDARQTQTFSNDPTAPLNTGFCIECHRQEIAPSARVCPGCGTGCPAEGWAMLPYPLRDGRYVLDAFVARGGMGVVYKAHPVGADVDVSVAIKFAVTGDIEKFRQEVAIQLHFKDYDVPGFVRVTDWNLDERPFYLVMTFVSEPTLQAVLDARISGRLDVATACEIARCVAERLHTLHQCEVIHRDIKPENIFVKLIDNIPSVILSDFGNAKIQRTTPLQDPRVSQFFATPRYVAPELLTLGRAVVTQASDIYGVGLMLYEMITGVWPYGDVNQNLADMLTRVRDAAPDIARLEVMAGRSLADVVARCLDKSPTARFASAASFIDALDGAHPPHNTDASADVSVVTIDMEDEEPHFPIMEVPGNGWLALTVAATLATLAYVFFGPAASF